MKSISYLTDGKSLRIGDFFYRKEAGEVTLTKYAGNKSRVVVPEGVDHLADESFSKTKIREVVLPSSVRTIGEKAFYCSTVQKINLPSSVENLGCRAFDCSGIVELTIENPKIFLYPAVFDHAYDLKEIRFSGTAEEWETIFFEQVRSADFTVRLADNKEIRYE